MAGLHRRCLRTTVSILSGPPQCPVCTRRFVWRIKHPAPLQLQKRRCTLLRQLTTSRRVPFAGSCSLGTPPAATVQASWLRANSRFEFDVACQGSGPLIQDYRDVARTTVLRNLAPLSLLLPSRWSAATALAVHAASLAARRFDLTYANTTAASPMLAALSGPKVPTVWHIHEMLFAIRQTLGSCDQRADLSGASRYIAVSEAAARSLQFELNAPTDRIDTIHGFVHAPESTAAQCLATRQRLLKEWGSPADSFVVGGCSSMEWHKGTDLFAHVARVCTDLPAGRRPMRFVWIGGEAAGAECSQLQHELQGLRLHDAGRYVPSTTKVGGCDALMDVFAPTSREDPYPLVMLEAGAHRVRTMCFADAGGGSEFVAKGAGIVAPYLDTAAFARTLTALPDDPELRGKLGGRCSTRRARSTQCTSPVAQAPTQH